ncbi:MAG: hypothetical protein ACK5GN_00035 [Pseudomonadota bacterium]
MPVKLARLLLDITIGVSSAPWIFKQKLLPNEGCRFLSQITVASTTSEAYISARCR